MNEIKVPEREPLGYDALKREIIDSPRTWKPALLAVLIKECVHKNVFKDTESIKSFVYQLIESAENPPIEGTE